MKIIITARISYRDMGEKKIQYVFNCIPGRTFYVHSLIPRIVPTSPSICPFLSFLPLIHVKTTRTQVPVEMVVEKIIKVPGEDRVVYKEVFVCVRVCTYKHKCGALQSSDG